jgi:hypothetical protein
MQKRGNLWMADWRDERGIRHRKGFNSRRRAEKHQDSMTKDIGEIKKAHASAKSAPLPRRGPGRRATRRTRGTPPAISGRSRAKSPSKNSHQSRQTK